LSLDVTINYVRYIPIPLFKLRDGTKYFNFLSGLHNEGAELVTEYMYLLEVVRIGKIIFIYIGWRRKMTVFIGQAKLKVSFR
jgi:hypothetical protein